MVSESGLRGGLTRRAGVRVPSTSNRQIVFLMLRLFSGGYTLAASVAMVVDLFRGDDLPNDCRCAGKMLGINVCCKGVQFTLAGLFGRKLSGACG